MSQYFVEIAAASTAAKKEREIIILCIFNLTEYVAKHNNTLLKSEICSTL